MMVLCEILVFMLFLVGSGCWYVVWFLNVDGRLVVIWLYCVVVLV